AIKASLQAELAGRPENGSELRTHGLEAVDFAHGYRAYTTVTGISFYGLAKSSIQCGPLMAVVHNKETNTQRVLHGHMTTDDILTSLCLTCIPMPILLHGARLLARKLASVGLDDNHCIVVWDWRKGERLATTRAHKTACFVIRWNPHDPTSSSPFGRPCSFASGQWPALAVTSSRGTFGSPLCYMRTTLRPPITCGRLRPARTVKPTKGPCFALEFIARPKPCFVTGGQRRHTFAYSTTHCEPLPARTFNLRNSNMGRAGKPGRAAEGQPHVRSVMPAPQQQPSWPALSTAKWFEIEKDGDAGAGAGPPAGLTVWGLALIATEPSASRPATIASLRGLAPRWPADARLPGADRSPPLLRHLARRSPCWRCFRDGSSSEEIPNIKIFAQSRENSLAVASHDNFVDIYQRGTQQRGPASAKGCSSYVTHIDCGRERAAKLLMLFFRSARGSKPAGPPKADIERATLATAGPALLGDTCEGRLAAKGKFAKYKQYVGHSAHVTIARLVVRRFRAHCDDSDTDSEGGGRITTATWSGEKRMDYASKTYQISPLRSAWASGHGAAAALAAMGLMLSGRPFEPQDAPSAKVVRGSPAATRSVAPSPARGGSPTDYSWSSCHGYTRALTAVQSALPQRRLEHHSVPRCRGGASVHQCRQAPSRSSSRHDDDILCLMVNGVPKFRRRGRQRSNRLADPPILASTWCQSVLDSQHTIAVWPLAGGPAGDHLRQAIPTRGSSRASFRPDSDSQFVSVGVKHVKFWDTGRESADVH
uniref:WD_REPEATS_REGION domain-containing protein n=1 Tax=Macrostomum lignano TaxID=282301 RepID=A0A1I8FPD1_9PLAT